ncbi:cytosine/adenosine deaminase-related metal-dependent hydrolase [Kibdelosporangium banguiense]|uniref:Cytosine/adenosine deaminase-related metal-dependent hydrolase n=1 Tax=Kibdelosporangium banguiense TaxID=1365924 RepID=A0ABS4T6K5_9PSEU|nr:amidohydrolase family protein [Kibdelosporangium banguiense]MBP2320059.1 cytosine/adenosine deaminase-related metal-dependent hydrolase [Kibdelosporangium banguiense]
MKVLLKGGYVLSEPGADVLVDGGSIAEIGPNLPAQGATVLNASGKVVIPGFVDTHRHMAQSPLRGFAADMTLEYYLANVVARIGARQDIDDVRNSLRLAAAEAIDAGVTTVLDWSGFSDPAQVDAAVETHQETGLRVLFGHSNPDDEADVRTRADQVKIALAPLGPDYLCIEDTTRHIRLARDLGVIATLHVGGGRNGAKAQSITRLHKEGLLGPDLNFVHANMISDDEVRMIADSGASLTVTPVVELMMGHGDLAYKRFTEAGGAPALGVDVVINNTPDMFSEMRTALLHERARRDSRPAAGDMLRAATINSAHAIGMGDEVGSLEVGKRADIVLLAGLEHLFGEGPETVAGGVVTSAGNSDVHTVLINGRIVKRDGLLIDHDLRDLREATLDIAHRTLAA